MKFLNRLLVFLLVFVAMGFSANQKFFVQLGYGLMASKGDFNDRALVVKDKDDNKGNLHPATLKILGTPDLTLGMNIRNYTLDLDFQYSSADQKLSGYIDQELEENTTLWRIGAEFTYNIYWPEFFQIGVGGGLSFAGVSTDDNLFFGAKTYDTDFWGMGIGAIADMRYSLTDHVSIVSALKVYENVFWSLDASPLDDDQLEDSLWQTFILITVTVRYQF